MNISSASIDTSMAQPAVKDVSSDEQSELMKEFSIGRSGRYYVWRGYRYECLTDAIEYAQLSKSRAGGADQSALTSEEAQPQEAAASPTAAEREDMFTLGIAFEKGQYVFAGYRYDRLIDADAYARKLQGIAPR
jgi:hypothetical protein